MRTHAVYTQVKKEKKFLSFTCSQVVTNLFEILSTTTHGNQTVDKSH